MPKTLHKNGHRQTRLNLREKLRRDCKTFILGTNSESWGPLRQQADSLRVAAHARRYDETREIALAETKTSLCTQFGFWNVLERIWVMADA